MLLFIFIVLVCLNLGSIIICLILVFSLILMFKFLFNCVSFWVMLYILFLIKCILNIILIIGIIEYSDGFCFGSIFMYNVWNVKSFCIFLLLI